MRTGADEPLAGPVGVSAWSRRAIVNVVRVLADHADSLTLVGGHAVVMRTADVDVPPDPTGDGDLGLTPGLVASSPRIEALMRDAGYEHRIASRPGLWGRDSFTSEDGRRDFREKVDLLTGKALSGASGGSRRGVPHLREHGSLSVANAPGLELSAFDRSRMVVRDHAAPELFVEMYVAEVPALICAKAFKISDRLADPRPGRVRDKDFGDLWRLMAASEPAAVRAVFAQFAEHEVIGPSVRLGLQRLRSLVADPLTSIRIDANFEGVVDPQKVAAVMEEWRGSFLG